MSSYVKLDPKEQFIVRSYTRAQVAKTFNVMIGQDKTDLAQLHPLFTPDDPRLTDKLCRQFVEVEANVIDCLDEVADSTFGYRLSLLEACQKRRRKEHHMDECTTQPECHCYHCERVREDERSRIARYLLTVGSSETVQRQQTCNEADRPEGEFGHGYYRCKLDKGHEGDHEAHGMVTTIHWAAVTL